jgi:hypothetical protein
MKCGVSPSRVSLLVIVSAYLRALTTRQLHVHVPTTLFVIASLIFQTPDVVAQEDVRVLILSAADSPSSIVIYEWYIGGCYCRSRSDVAHHMAVVYADSKQASGDGERKKFRAARGRAGEVR